MDVLVVGAGIGGLTAAIALRTNGHRVTIFEQSQLNQETGAAIFLPPNANGLLRTYGFDPEKWGANPSLEAWRLHSPWKIRTLEGTNEIHEKMEVDAYPNPWQMIHRQRLHSGLKELAQDPMRPGVPVDIKLSSRVASVDPETATIEFEDGDSVKGDVVIGADGVRSATRKAVQLRYGTTLTPFSSGTSAFRFLIPRKTLLEDAIARPMFESPGALRLWSGQGRKLVTYPCDHNETINFVAIHPAELSVTQDHDWNSEGSKVNMASIFSQLEPQARRALEIVDPSKVKLHSLLDMEPLPGWTHGRLALIGDAAHPMLPHLAQGGAQAIEDAISIAIFLSPDTKPSEIPRRLDLYAKARLTRAHNIQASSRMRKEDLLSRDDSQGPDFQPLTREETFLHNEIEHSTRILKEHLHEIVV